MNGPNPWIRGIMQLSQRWLPFADAATPELPLGRLLRLGLFQVSVGMAMTMVAGTLNRVMIVELSTAAALVAVMLALPLVAAPFRALIGFRSDVYQSVLGWKRVPFLWFGTMLQFGGFAILPFALLILNGDKDGGLLIGRIGAALGFLLVGAGAHTTQTAGLALATDLSPEEKRPRVVALLYVMLLLGMMVSALVFGRLLVDYNPLRLIQVVQGVAMATVVLNLIALWKQEPRVRRPAGWTPETPPAFREVWRRLKAQGRLYRLLVAVGLGTAGFGMQDVLLEPYGGQIMGLGVSQTTLLTALFAGGAIVAFGVSARVLGRSLDAGRVAAAGLVVGVFAFAAVVFSSPLGSANLLRVGAILIGFGGGLFSVGTLTYAMGLPEDTSADGPPLHGLAVGAWGAVQATCAGLALGLGGALRDGFMHLSAGGAFGPALAGPAAGYSFVYHLEIALLFAALVALGPLVGHTGARPVTGFGLAELPG